MDMKTGNSITRGDTGRARLRAALHRWETGRQRTAVDLNPGCSYGAVTRQMVDDIGRDLAEVKGRVNALLFGIAATFIAVVASAWLR